MKYVDPFGTTAKKPADGQGDDALVGGSDTSEYNTGDIISDIAKSNVGSTDWSYADPRGHSSANTN
ncbi:MAG: hypothetical protein GY932_01570, partial [Arcobacter sp.]|nr:hypothetical protein [Arcobacter sp.]